MNRIQKIRNSVARAIAPSQKNAVDLGKQFLRNGSKSMPDDWTTVDISDFDLYSGYGYAIINKRANKVARVATENIRTDSSNSEIDHPYLDVITKSSSFSNYEFWFTNSVYLDLEGISYLMAVRNYDPESGIYGEIKSFKILNPYNVRRITKTDNKGLQVAGYVESHNGMVREIPAHMVIEIRELNPFSSTEPFAMTDAAKENQYALKVAGDFTRHSLKHNTNAPAIISTDVELPDEEFDKFQDRVLGRTKGEPIFGNGEGAINYQENNIDLSNSALTEVNDVNRDMLFTVGGVSKTTMGIEQSGTTRDTALIQKDLNIEDNILPRIQKIIDSLNQDYVNNYPQKQATNGAYLVVDNPILTDHEAEKKDVEVKREKISLVTEMIRAGFDKEEATRYVDGELQIDAIAIPEVTETISQGTHAVNPTPQANEAKSLIDQQQGSLENGIVNIDQRIVSTAVERIGKKKNKIEVDRGDVVTKTQEEEFKRDFAALLLGFYGIVVAFEGSNVLRQRISQFGLGASFSVGRSTNRSIADLSRMAAASHVETIISDIYRVAREGAIAGKSIDEIQRELRNLYGEQISKASAKRLARSETNRAYSFAQYEADRQFIDQNNLHDRAYKKWETRSSDPCPFCLELQRQGKIPFDEPFRNLGQRIAPPKVKPMTVTYEELHYGNAHPNCSCIYRLIITPSNDNSAKPGKSDTMKNKTKTLDEFIEKIDEI